MGVLTSLEGYCHTVFWKYYINLYVIYIFEKTYHHAIGSSIPCFAFYKYLLI